MKKMLNQECLGDLTISRENAQDSGFLPRNEMWACVPLEKPSSVDSFPDWNRDDGSLQLCLSFLQCVWDFGCHTGVCPL